MTTERDLAAALALILTITGCQSAQPAKTNLLLVNGIPELESPHPRAVTATLDSAHSASVTLSPAGGALAATAADGTTFQLTIPDGALLGTTTVTMTPVSQLSGAPLSVGAVEGVQLGPDGLILAQPATLTITPKGAVGPVAQQIGFGYAGTGTSFHFVMLDAVAAISLHILHFCGYGVGGASASDLQSQSGSPPTQSYDQVAQAIALKTQQLIAQAREEQLANPNAGISLGSIINPILDDYYVKVLAPTLIEAETHPDLAPDALVLSLQYLRTAGLVGSDLHESDVTAAWLKILQKEISQIVCSAARGTATVSDYFGIIRQGELVGMQGPAVYGGDVLLGRCLVFTLDFDVDSQFIYDSVPWAIKTQMHGLRLAPSSWTGQMPISLQVGAQPAGSCHQLHNPQATQPFSVDALVFESSMTQHDSDPRPQFSLSGLRMLMHPGEATADEYDDCAGLLNAKGVHLIDCAGDRRGHLVWACWGLDNLRRRSAQGSFLFSEWTYPTSGAVIVQLSVKGGLVADNIPLDTSTTTMTLTLTPAA